MELVWSAVQLGSIRSVLRESRVSHCLGLCKVYEEKTGWIVIRDHLSFAHAIAKDAKHPSVLSKQTKEARVECNQHTLYVDMSEDRFQAVLCRHVGGQIPSSLHRGTSLGGCCLSAMSSVQKSVHPTWKIIKAGPL